MTSEQLTAALAEKIMGWSIGPDRFMQANRGWMPRWRFRPAERLDDAFRLLEEARPQEYSICGDDTGNVHVLVRIASGVGESRGTARALVITQAIARAVGIDDESSVPPRQCLVKHPPLPKHGSPGTRAADTKRRGRI
jgi:hypothetical protein